MHSSTQSILIALLITRASKVLATNICSKKPFSFNVSVEDATMFFYLNNNWNKSFYILFYFSNYVNLVDFHSLKHPTQTNKLQNLLNVQYHLNLLHFFDIGLKLSIYQVVYLFLQ